MPLNPKQTAHSLLYSLAVELEPAVARGVERGCRGLLNYFKVSNIYLSWLLMSYFASHFMGASWREVDLNKSPWQRKRELFSCLVGLWKGHDALKNTDMFLSAPSPGFACGKGDTQPQNWAPSAPNGTQANTTVRHSTREPMAVPKDTHHLFFFPDLPRSSLVIFSQPISSTIIKRCIFSSLLLLSLSWR